MHDEQCGVNYALAIGGDITQTIDSLINAGIGVDIAAEVDTDGFEVLDDSFSGEVLRTIERHMLKEVRQSILVVLLEDSPHGLGYMEICALFRLLIMPDIVSQSVIQFSDAYIGVNR